MWRLVVVLSCLLLVGVAAVEENIRVTMDGESLPAPSQTSNVQNLLEQIIKRMADMEQGVSAVKEAQATLKNDIRNDMQKVLEQGDALKSKENDKSAEELAKLSQRIRDLERSVKDDETGGEVRLIREWIQGLDEVVKQSDKSQELAKISSHIEQLGQAFKEDATSAELSAIVKQLIQVSEAVQLVRDAQTIADEARGEQEAAARGMVSSGLGEMNKELSAFAEDHKKQVSSLFEDMKSLHVMLSTSDRKQDDLLDTLEDIRKNQEKNVVEIAEALKEAYRSSESKQIQQHSFFATETTQVLAKFQAEQEGVATQISRVWAYLTGTQEELEAKLAAAKQQTEDAQHALQAVQEESTVVLKDNQLALARVNERQDELHSEQERALRALNLTTTYLQQLQAGQQQVITSQADVRSELENILGKEFSRVAEAQASVLSQVTSALQAQSDAMGEVASQTDVAALARELSEHRNEYASQKDLLLHIQEASSHVPQLLEQLQVLSEKVAVGKELEKTSLEVESLKRFAEDNFMETTARLGQLLTALDQVNKQSREDQAKSETALSSTKEALMTALRAQIEGLRTTLSETAADLQSLQAVAVADQTLALKQELEQRGQEVTGGLDMLRVAGLATKEAIDLQTQALDRMEGRIKRVERVVDVIGSIQGKYLEDTIMYMDRAMELDQELWTEAVQTSSKSYYGFCLVLAIVLSWPVRLRSARWRLAAIVAAALAVEMFFLEVLQFFINNTIQAGAPELLQLLGAKLAELGILLPSVTVSSPSQTQVAQIARAFVLLAFVVQLIRSWLSYTDWTLKEREALLENRRLLQELMAKVQAGEGLGGTIAADITKLIAQQVASSIRSSLANQSHPVIEEGETIYPPEQDWVTEEEDVPEVTPRRKATRTKAAAKKSTSKKPSTKKTPARYRTRAQAESPAPTRSTRSRSRV